MKIIAHRGNDGIHKENSLEAIINSLNQKYIDGVELDVRLTKDKKLIINHDPFYNGYYISHTNIIKLQKLGLNTLEEVLSNVNNNNKIIMIEVKTSDKEIKQMTKTLIKTLNKYHLNYYICSFNYDFLNTFKKSSNFKAGLIISAQINTKHINNNFDFNSVSILYHKKIPSKETFRWTVNTQKELDKINKTENIITDNPLELSKIKPQS